MDKHVSYGQTTCTISI